MKIRRSFPRFAIPVLAAALAFFGPYVGISNASASQLSGPVLSVIPDSTLTAMGRMRRPAGMAPWQFNSYIRACEKAKVSPQRVLQTVGNAKASAGFHHQDGWAREQGDVFVYCAATDLRTRDLTREQIYALQNALTDAYFGGFYRTGPKWIGNNHIHTIWTGYPMKGELRSQIKDFLADKNGLVGHAKETFYKASPAQKKRLKIVFLKRNS
jgi:hypothetical protein